jgi:hypothetical protein
MSKSDEQIEHADRTRAKAAARKALPSGTRNGRSVADWANADAALLLELVCAVAVDGGAVRFGYTRDGGAYSIGLYLGADSKTYYCNETEGINEHLREHINYFKE